MPVIWNSPFKVNMDFLHIRPKLVSQSSCAWILLINRKIILRNGRLRESFPVEELSLRQPGGLRIDSCRTMASSLPFQSKEIQEAPRGPFFRGLVTAYFAFAAHTLGGPCPLLWPPLTCTLTPCTVVSPPSYLLHKQNHIYWDLLGISRYVPNRAHSLDTPSLAHRHVLLLNEPVVMDGTIAYYINSLKTSELSLVPFLHYFA